MAWTTTCPRCGAARNTTDRFCASCGAAQSDGAPSAVAEIDLSAAAASVTPASVATSPASLASAPPASAPAAVAAPPPPPPQPPPAPVAPAPSRSGVSMAPSVAPPPPPQAAPGRQMATTVAESATGLIVSLYDFRFASLMATKAIKIAYALLVALSSFFTLIMLLACFATRSAGVIVFGFIVLPVTYLIGLICLRICAEFFIVFFKMGQDLQRVDQTTRARVTGNSS
jgi:hypothetical protein